MISLIAHINHPSSTTPPKEVFNLEFLLTSAYPICTRFCVDNITMSPQLFQTMKKTLFLCTLSLLGVATANISANASLLNTAAITWSNPNGSGQITPSVASIIGGPWVLYGNVQGSGTCGAKLSIAKLLC